MSGERGEFHLNPGLGLGTDEFNGLTLDRCPVYAPYGDGVVGRFKQRVPTEGDNWDCLESLSLTQSHQNAGSDAGCVLDWFCRGPVEASREEVFQQARRGEADCGGLPPRNLHDGSWILEWRL